MSTFFLPTRILLRSCTEISRKMAKIIKLDDDMLEKQLSMAAKSLQAGNIIAVPTDTIYGLAGLAQSTEAVEQIYAIKGRNSSKPVAISVAEVSDIPRWARMTVPMELLQDLLPGPVTVVMQRTAALNTNLNPSTDLVGIRVPQHKFMRQLAETCMEPIALTSANTSAAGNTIDIQEFENLWPQLDLVLDGGRLESTQAVREGSTVVDLSVEGQFRVLRVGCAYMSTVDVLANKYDLTDITEYVIPNGVH
ncbi:yrdC domain-containing protein, mitochondrial-like isoform X1 [Branchiostoma floridae]|uniref:Threonylcarbamoyl-AMP synthase n=2 Tax=Branchiostoma floridae TaxID=7739 RepID=A0A9J7LQ14_BRAFL|nr:yrdC domain-containing protein, mitochondrial-like isoform X1 [Branchiostoma floridae]